LQEQVHQQLKCQQSVAFGKDAVKSANWQLRHLANTQLPNSKQPMCMHEAEELYAMGPAFLCVLQ
jgi:hypothetical protein